MSHTLCHIRGSISAVFQHERTNIRIVTRKHDQSSKINFIPQTMETADREHQYAESLSRAQHGNSLLNFATIYKGFTDKGIALSDIRPRENVFTYGAWRALGRQVKKGEHGIKVTTRIAMKKEMENGDTARYSLPSMATVFHLSQTEEIL
jgi:hypothetical protein